MRPASTASVPARSLAKWSAFASSASLRYRLPAWSETTVREASIAITSAIAAKTHQRRLDLELDPADEPRDRHARDGEADRDEERRLGERGEVLRLPVAEGMARVGGAHRDGDGEEREQRGAEVGSRVRRLGEEAEASAREPGAELDRDEQAGGPDRDERGAPLRRHARKARARSVVRGSRVAPARARSPRRAP